jgi:hypothetical protein
MTLVGRDQFFAFEFEPKVQAAAAVFGVFPRTTAVEVDDLRLRIRFGPWRLTTPITNVVDATLSGPYQWWKVAGPPHLSFSDRGVTFATNTRQGLCLAFREPVSAILPGGLLRHPGATVTVADPEGLAHALRRST